MCVCKGCAFEYEWKQGDTSVPDECIGCQVMDGKPTNFKPKPMTNADRIRAMSDEELAEFIRSMVDEDYTHEVACYGCISYGTHHSDPANKGTNLYECDGCSCEGVGLDVLKWLQLPAGEDE